MEFYIFNSIYHYHRKMEIKKSIKTKGTELIMIPLGILADIMYFGNSGTGIMTPRRCICQRVKVTILAISIMLVLTSFTMSGLDLALGVKYKGQDDNNHFKGNDNKHNFGDGSRFNNHDGNNHDHDGNNHDHDGNNHDHDGNNHDHDGNHYTKTIVVHDDDNNNNNEQTIIVNSNLQGTCFVTQSQIDGIPGLVSQLLNQCTSVTVIQG
jgi:hypothetical protein